MIDALYANRIITALVFVRAVYMSFVSMCDSYIGETGRPLKLLLQNTSNFLPHVDKGRTSGQMAK